LEPPFPWGLLPATWDGHETRNFRPLQLWEKLDGSNPTELTPASNLDLRQYKPKMKGQKPEIKV